MSSKDLDFFRGTDGGRHIAIFDRRESD